MRKFLNCWMMAALAVSLTMGMTACSDEKDDNEEEEQTQTTATLKFVNEADAKLDVDPEALADYVVKIETSAKLEEIAVEQVNEQAWCEVTVKSKSELSVKAGANPNETDREAKFKITAAGASLDFSVTQAGVSPEGATLSIEANDDVKYEYVYTYNGDNSGKTVSVQVTTTASRWKAVVRKSMGEEDESLDWIKIENPRGKSGDMLKFSLTPNNTTQMQSGTIVISAGDAEPITIYVSQNFPVGTYYKLFTDAEKTQEFANGTTLTFDAAYADGAAGRIRDFYVETDGAVFALVCEEGTMDDVSWDEDCWLSVGTSTDGLRITLIGNNTTGEERRYDVVIADNEYGYGNELFRIPVVQKAE